MDEEQLVDFCHQLGLAKDGYLNENDLSVVCRCIGLVASEEMMKQLFEELDGDNDGRVCLAELSLMLRGMQLQSKKGSASSSSFSEKKQDESGEDQKGLDFLPLEINDPCAFSVLDPQHKGFAKAGAILDFWSRLGINERSSVQILKELGFSAHSRLNSINLQDLGRSLDDETDHSKEVELPPVFQAALVTYRTEAQYLRSLCETMECEREKLKSDISEAHQRCEMLAQEVDEQNARLEKTSQMQLHKVEAKYNEHIQALQRNAAVEKESLQQTIQKLESQLNLIREEESKLKSQISELKQENAQLDNEVKNLTKEVKQLTRTKAQVEEEMSHYIELEKKVQQMERQNIEKEKLAEEKLETSITEIQSLKDQNDELSSQLANMKETLNMMKPEGKRSLRRRRKKGSLRHKQGEGTNTDEELTSVPLQKIGKFHKEFSLVETENTSLQIQYDVEEAESSLDPAFISCSEPDSGTFLNTVIKIDGCVTDATSTDVKPINYGRNDKDEKMSIGEDSNDDSDPLKGPSVREECQILQRQVDRLKLHAQEILIKFGIPDDPYGSHFKKYVEGLLKKLSSNGHEHETDKMLELEQQLEQAKAEFSSEKGKLESSCSDLEKSLDLLQAEYEKCEEYWHGKLQEERIEYEHDRNISDEKFLELSLKIKEYEEMFLQQPSDPVVNKLPPIEERASLEQQVNDLDSECSCLRDQLQSLKEEQETIISNYQRNLQFKMSEECSQLEQQVKVLQLKCQDYEIRLASITDEEQHDDGNELVGTLKTRIEALEKELRAQRKRHDQHLQHLEQSWNTKSTDTERPGQKSQNTVAKLGPLFCETDSSPKIDLLGMLHSPQHDAIWSHKIPTSFYQSVDKTSSLPLIPVNSSKVPNGSTNSGPWMAFNSLETWAPNSQPTRKAWCHVEVAWLQALRVRLKQREEQCIVLQGVLHSLEQQHEVILTEMKHQHNTEIYNWESLMRASQDLVRQQAAKQKEQADKLSQADSIMKDLWAENTKLMSALTVSQQRAMYLESVLQKSNVSCPADAEPRSIPNGNSFPKPHFVPEPNSSQNINSHHDNAFPSF